MFVENFIDNLTIIENEDEKVRELDTNTKLLVNRVTRLKNQCVSMGKTL